MSSPSSSSSSSSPSSSSSSSPSSPAAAAESNASPRSAAPKKFVDDEAGSSPGGSPGPENDLFGAEDPHEEAPNSEDELMDEIEAEKERAPSPSEEPPSPTPETRAAATREPAQHRPVRTMTVQPSFCPGANTPQGIEATDGNNGINKILLCWNSYGMVTRQMLTPQDVELPDDEVPESAIETTYTTPGAPSRINRLKDSVYGWSMASVSDKGVVLGAPCLATESSEEDAYDEDDFVTDAKPTGEASQNVARVHFRPSATYRPGISTSGPRDWTATIPLGEQLITVAIGRDFIAALTFCRKAGTRVRTWSLNAGLPTNVITAGGPTSRPVSLAASPLSGVILWAVADDGGDAAKIKYSLVRTSGSGSRVGMLAEGPLAVSGDVHHHAGEGPILTWIGMTSESIPLSMDSVGVMRALVPMGVTVGCHSTQLEWMPIYDCMAELQRENEGFWAIGGAGATLHISRTRYEDAYEPRGSPLPRIIPSIEWRIRLGFSRGSDKVNLGERPENERAFAERLVADWKVFCQEHGVDLGTDSSEIRKTTVALDKKLVTTFRDLIQSKQIEAAYDTSTLAMQIPATPRFMAKMALKLGQPLLAARIEEDMASIVVATSAASSAPMPKPSPSPAKPVAGKLPSAAPLGRTAPPRNAFEAAESIQPREPIQKTAEANGQETSRRPASRGNPFANRKRRQDDMDDSNAAKVLRADG